VSPGGETSAFLLKARAGTVEDSDVRRPRLLPSLSSAAAVALAVAVGVVATQAGDARPGVREASAATVADPSAHPRAASAIDPTLTASVKSAMSKSTSSSYAVVVDIEGVGRVVDINGGQGLLPASTEKMFTTLPMLLNRPQDRFVTTIASTSAPTNGVVHGDLVVQASADPTVMGGTLVDLAKQVHANGVRRVTGRLVLSLNGLSAARTRPGWKSSYVPWDIGPLSPFPVHDDGWRTSSGYVAHPTAGNLALLRSKLAGVGVKIQGASAIVSSASASTQLATHSSRTIAAIVARTLRISDNFAAEQMLTVEGWSAVHALESQMGTGGTATDGSGLSLRDRRSAEDEVTLLEYAHTSAAAQMFFDSLPVMCKTGTLKDEMCKTIANGHVFAKTGTIDHVKALAGYTTDAKGRWVTFAMLTNGDTYTSKAMNAMEHAVLLLRHYDQ
jgi:serine-type D-Ala-D-Ala carboxypeptidase/endopeptidase (penicillin-binding protein 4)